MKKKPVHGGRAKTFMRKKDLTSVGMKTLHDAMGTRIIDIEAAYVEDEAFDAGQLVGAEEIEITLNGGNVLRFYVNAEGKLVMEID